MANKKRVFSETKSKTYAFIDASNIIYGAKAEGWFIDQKKLLDYLKEKFSISSAFFYYGKDSKNDKQEKFLDKLQEFGFILRVKEIKRYGSKSKANCDVDLTMDMLIKHKEYQRAIVLSGDGDFAPLFAYLIKQGKEIIVISSPKRTAREIKSLVGGKYMDFNGLRYFIERKTQKKRETLN